MKQRTSLSSRRTSSADEDLRACQSRLNRALQIGGMIAFDIDVESGMMKLSDHAHDLIGFAAGSFDDFVAAIHPVDRARVHAALEQVIATDASLQVEFRVLAAGDQQVWLSLSGDIENGHGGGRRLTGFCVDITERKTLQHALERSEERARDFAAISSDWLWETDENMRFTLIWGGPADARYRLSSMIGKTRWEFAEADPRSQPWKEHIRQHKMLLPFRNFEYEVPDSAGRARLISTGGGPRFDNEGRFLGYRGTASDQTARRSLEAKLHQAQRMEAIGQLSGGVAHDFNNLLTIILGNADVLMERFASDREIQPLAAIILDAAERGADLTDRLLAFARRHVLEPASVSVNAAVERMADILQRSVGAHITLTLDLAEDLHPALVDATLLETTVLNLAVNARDAMPDGGTLTLETSNRAIAPHDGDEDAELAPGDYVQIAIVDTGFGMEPEVMARAFEPYFSTKETGKGSGLGLPMAQGFARQSGGQITIESRPGCGTRVNLILPRSRALPDAIVEPVAANDLPCGSERILVVEDEPEVRRFVVGQLSSLGYETELAMDGPSALAVLQQGKRFDLLFTDIVLPARMSGIELAERAQHIDPRIRVLFSTGYSEQITAFEDVRHIGSLLLLKPYRRRELALMVRRACDAETL